MPFGLGNQVHFLMQKLLTREWPRKLDVLYDLLEAARKITALSGKDIQGCQFLEIGAGRDLATAVALRMLGAKHITCVDISRLARPALIQHAAQHIANALHVAAPKLKGWDDIEEFGITYIAPSSLQNVRIEPRSIDIFYSVDTLEHVPSQALKSILSYSKGLLNENGKMVHFIDYTDHYARGNSISRFNFLQYSDEQWKRHNSSFQYVNRLRHSEYVEIFEDAGLRLDHVETDQGQDSHGIAQQLAPQFQKFELEDLFTLRSRIVASA
jgi:cyclopropane fatty-acyl-phospholipid synthase-like methyltransferase